MEMHSLSALFHTFPRPVLFVQDGRIVYANPAALTLSPDLVGSEPAFLGAALEPSYPVTGSCSAFSRHWQFSASPTQGGVLLLLTPFSEGSPSAGAFGRFTQQFRQHLGNLSAAGHLLAPVIQDQNSDKYDQYLAIMNQSFYRLMQLINAADIERALSGGSLSFHPETLDLSVFIQKLAQEVQPLSEAMGVAFSSACDCPLLLLTADSSLLRQMLLALLSNAFKAAGKGGEVTLHLSRTEQRAILTVTDNGPGLPSPSAEGSLPRPGDGIGVGLPFAQQAALLHGGTLLMENRSGSGVRAVVSLPIAPPPGDILRTPAPTPAGGFSSLLLAFADLLPWQSFRMPELE